MTNLLICSSSNPCSILKSCKERNSCDEFDWMLFFVGEVGLFLFLLPLSVNLFSAGSAAEIARKNDRKVIQSFVKYYYIILIILWRIKSQRLNFFETRDFHLRHKCSYLSQYRKLICLFSYPLHPYYNITLTFCNQFELSLVVFNDPKNKIGANRECWLYIQLSSKRPPLSALAMQERVLLMHKKVIRQLFGNT